MNTPPAPIKVQWTKHPDPITEYLSYLVIRSTTMLDEVAVTILTKEMKMTRK